MRTLAVSPDALSGVAAELNRLAWQLRFVADRGGRAMNSKLPELQSAGPPIDSHWAAISRALHTLADGYASMGAAVWSVAQSYRTHDARLLKLR